MEAITSELGSPAGSAARAEVWIRRAFCRYCAQAVQVERCVSSFLNFRSDNSPVSASNMACSASLQFMLALL
jgi:hypothetical protein